MKSLACLMLSALALQSCAMSPGMKMKEDSGSVWFPDEPGRKAGRTLTVTPITAALVNQMESERKTRARNIASEFSQTPTNYRIGPGDVLQVTVWDHPELTIPAGSFRDPESSGQQVGDDGNLYYPYVGVIQAAGMTVTELREELTEKLSTFIQNPQLDVRVVGFRSKRVYVVGEVNRPGVLPLNDVPLMVADAISLSGGLTEAAHKSGVNISRDSKVYEIDLKAMYDYADASQNLMLKHGDIINVLDRSQQKVFVLGEVNKPSSVEIINGQLTLAGALGEVGGVDQQTANSGRIFVIRGSSKENPEIFQLDARSAHSLLLAERFDMQAQDVIFVDTAGVSSWNRVITQLLPSISVVGIVDNIQ